MQQLVPPILERFKEKNIVMSKAAEESLRALFEHCITVGEAAEDLVEACGHKNPKGGLPYVMACRAGLGDVFLCLWRGGEKHGGGVCPPLHNSLSC